MRVSSLPKAVTWKRTGQDSNLRPFGRQRTLYIYRYATQATAMVDIKTFTGWTFVAFQPT